jgi:PAS domain S-box-containing protein
VRRNAGAWAEGRGGQAGGIMKSLLGRDESKQVVTDPRGHFELSSELLATLDQDGYFKRVTPVWERMLGHSIKDMLARPMVYFVHPDDFAQAQAELRRLADGGSEPTTFEVRWRRADGEYVWLEWQARLSAADGLIYAVARDLTERRRWADELHRAKEHGEQANRAKSEFLARMSHELRTPLTSVIGFSELLLKDGLSPDQELKLTHILKAGRHLLGLIDELLDIERIEAGTMATSPEPIQVGGLLRDAIALAQPQAAERDLRIHADLDACRDRYVMADQQRLRQVALNLLSNAIKYNRPGGEVRLSTEVTGEQTLRIHVSDTGAGLTDEQLRRLFVPFERLGAEETSIEGTGLGLVVSQRLIELMGGRLSAESEVEVGSTFTIELGLTEAPRVTTDEPAPAVKSNGDRPLAGRTVLYIEDNLANLDLVRELLGAAGARLLTARDGRSGFSVARQQHPDLILLDLHLPDLSGEQILAALGRDAGLRDIPVIAVSANATRDSMRDVFDRGVAAYMTKPFDTSSLVDSIEQALLKQATS